MLAGVVTVKDLSPPICGMNCVEIYYDFCSYRPRFLGENITWWSLMHCTKKFSPVNVTKSAVF